MIAAGGTLGIMIPPSTILVIYGIVTETNIGKLFAAGVHPGAADCALLMLGAVASITWRDPEHAGPAGERTTWPRALARAARHLGRGCCWWSSCWAASTAASSPPPRARASARRAPSSSRWRAARLTWRVLLQVLVEIGAHHGDAVHAADRRDAVFANFVNFTTMPGDLKDWITAPGPVAR